MRKITLLFIAAFVLLDVASITFAQTPSLQWAKRTGGSGLDQIKSSKTDASGNILNAGTFGGTVDFDPGAGTFNLTSAGVDDIFIQKLDAAGNFMWAKRIGGTGDNIVNSLYIDVAGNLYLTGAFQGTTDFDPGVGTANLTAGFLNTFILKLDPTGGYLWARAILSPDHVYGSDITVDLSGNVFTTGEFYDTADFDPGSGTYNLNAGVSNGTTDPSAFILKLDANGIFLWAGVIGDGGTQYALSIVTDGLENVYMLGYDNDTGGTDFDPGPGVFLAPYLDGAFIEKLDGAGNFVWVKRIDADVQSMHSDLAGNIYLTGQFSGTVDFDPGPGVFNLTAASSGNSIFISKLDSAANFQWAVKMGNQFDNKGNSITSDAVGNVYTTGYFTNSVDFDPGMSTFNLTSAGSYDIFVSKLDASGSFKWAARLGGSNWDVGVSVTTDAMGNIFAGGYFHGTADFDPGAGTYNLTSAGGNDCFMLKLCPEIAEAGPDQVVCSSTTTTLAATPPSFSTGLWSVVSGGATVTNTSDPSSTVTGLSMGIHIFCWTITDGTCTSSDTVKVEVGTFPFPSTFAGFPQELCNTTTATLSASPLLTGTGSWSVVTGGAVITSPTNNVTNVTGLTPGLNTFRWTTVNGVCSAFDDVDVTVYPTPSTADAGPDQTLCGATTATLAANTPSAGTGMWTVLAGSATVTDPTDPNSTVTGLSTGSNIFEWSITSGSCFPSFDETEITVLGGTGVTSDAGSDQSLCGGTNATLDATAAGGGSTGSWTVITGGATVVNPANPSSSVTGLTMGINTFRWTVSNGTCSSDDDVNIVVSAAVPSQPSVISGAPVSVCPPATGITLSVVNDPSVVSYQWSGSQGVVFNPVSTGNTQTIDLTATVNSNYKILVTATNACGTSLQRGISIRRSVSTPASVSGPSTVCAGNTYNYSTGAVTGATSYVWSGPSGTLFDGTNPSPYTSVSNNVTATFSSTFTSGAIGVAAQVACFTSPVKSISVATSAFGIGVISGNDVTCPNTMYSYSIVPVSGAASYNWQLPSGATGGSVTNSINVTYGSAVTSSDICVTATSVCGVVTAPRCKSISSGVPARPATITGPTNGLCGQAASYNTPFISGVSYNWTLPAGSTGSSSANTINAQMPSSFGKATVCVNVNNSCGTSLDRCITVKGSPNTPGVITPTPGSWCNGDTGIQFITDISNVAGNYILNWQINPSTAGTITMGQGTSTAKVNWNTGNAVVSITAQNGCGYGTRTYNAITGCREMQDEVVVNEKMLEVYPNPAQQDIYIRFFSESEAQAEVRLTDMAGRQIKIFKSKTTPGENKMQCDLSGIAKGVYEMVIITANDRQVRRVVVN